MAARPAVRAVLLDYGHTLVDYTRPEAELLQAYQRINERLEAELERKVPQAADLLRALSARLDEIVAESYGSGSEQEVDFGQIYDDALGAMGLHLTAATKRWAMLEEQRAWIHGLTPSPRAKPTLAELKRRGLRLALVSNTAYPPEGMRLHLSHLGILGCFDATVYSSEVGVRKPNPAIYQDALGRLGVTADQALFVGDRLREDVRGPRALGIASVLTHEFRQEEPDTDENVQIIADLSELPALAS